jgi:hypothetical protein
MTQSFSEIFHTTTIPQVRQICRADPDIARKIASYPPEKQDEALAIAVDFYAPHVILELCNTIREASGLPPFTADECSPDNCLECARHQDGKCTNNLPWPNGTPPEPPCFEFSDRLIALREHADEMRTQHGDKDIRTIAAISDAMAALPPFLKRKVDAHMAECGFVKPKPCGYSDDGEPLYSLADLAEMVGVSEEEAIARAREMDDELAAHGIDLGTHHGTVHAVQ